MKLTICLVSKGRKEFLNEALHSYEKFINSDAVEVLLIDNGADIVSTEILQSWKSKHGSKVHYYRSEINQKNNVAYFWDIISLHGPEWIIFPGDDDKLVFEIYAELKEAINDNQNLTAFAASAQIINETSDVTGETRIPAIYGVVNQPDLIAKSLHEPPFFWPSLFINFSAIPRTVISSRFVFDWWIGLQIVLKANFKATKSIGIHYRIHERQESFQSSSRRKNFEGFNMLAGFVGSDSFIECANLMSDSELATLFDLCAKNKPLYSQPEYSSALLKDLAVCISQICRTKENSNRIAETFLLSSGIYTKINDLENIYTGLSFDERVSAGNLAIILSAGVCANIRRGEYFFDSHSLATANIACNHSKSNRKSVIVDCKNFNFLEDSEIADRILLAMESHQENIGNLNFIVTPFESELIRFYRRLKFRMPNLVRTNIRGIKRFIRNKNAA